MEAVANPVLLYAAIALGGVGVLLALPKRGISPQLIGAILAAAGLGGAFLAMGLKAGAERPGFYFYIFSAIALGAALRVISHPRPVYAALYFIMTILASSALYLMLGAEFMAFALIIIYAGAILITYLFVIMLAEQSPDPSAVGETSEYDRFAREPAAAVMVGFVLLALLTSMMGRGVQGLPAAEPRGQGMALLERMPKKVLAAYDRLGVFEPRGGLTRPGLNEVAGLLDIESGTMRFEVADAAKFAERASDAGISRLWKPDGAERVVTLRLPDELRSENLDGVGFALIAEHPMALELAGVILLMAMLGAVVLARKQIEIGEREKAEAARR